MVAKWDFPHMLGSYLQTWEGWEGLCVSSPCAGRPGIDATPRYALVHAPAHMETNINGGTVVG